MTLEVEKKNRGKSAEEKEEFVFCFAYSFVIKTVIVVYNFVRFVVKKTYDVNYTVKMRSRVSSYFFSLSRFFFFFFFVEVSLPLVL